MLLDKFMVKTGSEKQSVKIGKSCRLTRKWSTFKVVDKFVVFTKEISTIEKKPCTLHRDNRKHALRKPQESTRPTNHRAKDIKV
jgi:hypothetical protein